MVIKSLDEKITSEDYKEDSQKIGSWSPSPCSPCVELSLSKTLNPKLLAGRCYPGMD